VQEICGRVVPSLKLLRSKDRLKGAEDIGRTQRGEPPETQRAPGW
jgi:hypothetical protein